MPRPHIYGPPFRNPDSPLSSPSPSPPPRRYRTRRNRAVTPTTEVWGKPPNTPPRPAPWYWEVHTPTEDTQLGSPRRLRAIELERTPAPQRGRHRGSSDDSDDEDDDRWLIRGERKRRRVYDSDQEEERPPPSNDSVQFLRQAQGPRDDESAIFLRKTVTDHAQEPLFLPGPNDSSHSDAHVSLGYSVQYNSRPPQDAPEIVVVQDSSDEEAPPRRR